MRPIATVRLNLRPSQRRPKSSLLILSQRRLRQPQRLRRLQRRPKLILSPPWFQYRRCLKSPVSLQIIWVGHLCPAVVVLVLACLHLKKWLSKCRAASWRHHYLECIPKGSYPWGFFRGRGLVLSQKNNDGRCDLGFTVYGMRFKASRRPCTADPVNPSRLAWQTTRLAIAQKPQATVQVKGPIPGGGLGANQVDVGLKRRHYRHQV